MCSERERLFVVEYLVDLNGTQAAIRSHYSPRSARQQGADILAKPYVRELVNRELEARRARVRKEADDVVQLWWDIGTCDVNDLVETRRVCCRHCWGEDFQYQRTQNERDKALELYDDDMAAHQAQLAIIESKGDAWKGKKPKPPAPFKELGGIGFDKWADPNPECPECAGQGEMATYIHDSRDLSPAAKRLYAGVKVTESGRVTVNMRAQDEAIVNVAKHIGMFIERHANVDVMSPEERKEAVLGIIRTAQARKKAAEGK